MMPFFKKGYTSKDLFEVARRGDFKRLQAILQSEVTVDVKDSTSRTPLCLAAKYGYPVIIRALVSAGADVNHRDREGRTPLFFAVKENQSASVEALMSLGADPNVSDLAGYTPMTYAKAKGYSKIQDLLNPSDGTDSSGEANPEASNS